MYNRDTPFTYEPLPYNIQDKNPSVNRGGLKPSYRYKDTKIVWLNSAFASTTVNSGNTHYEHSWDLPPFQLYNRTKLTVVSYTSNESNAKPIIMKIKDLVYDADSTYNSDKEAFPTLFVAHTAVASQLNDNQFSLILMPQLVSRITIALSNSFTVRNNGFTINNSNGNGHYIIGLLFEDEDLVADDASSMYK